jgi:hypothetical protein
MGQAGVIEEVRDVAIGDVEITKAMEQVGPIAPPGRVPPVMLNCVCPLGRGPVD